jgi:surface protein
MGYKGILPFMPKPRPFIIEVKTDNAGSGSNQFIIPTTGSGYNYIVRTSSGVTTGNTGNVTIAWPTVGTYEVEIYGNFPRIYFNNTGDKSKVLKIKQWGEIQWTSMRNAFAGCSNLDLTAIDVPNLSGVIDLGSIFGGCINLVNSNGSISNWNISNISTLTTSFSNCQLFNKSLSSWNTSNVITMIGTFQSCFNFNQDISSWNTANVTNMQTMFSGATNFNQPIITSGSQWDVSKVTSMQAMFNNTAFNQDLSSWQLRLAGVTLSSIFNGSGMSTANYTDTIVGWANYVQTNSGTPANVLMDNQGVSRTFQNSRPGAPGFPTAGAARTYLTSATPVGAGWSISDTIIA